MPTFVGETIKVDVDINSNVPLSFVTPESRVIHRDLFSRLKLLISSFGIVCETLLVLAQDPSTIELAIPLATRITEVFAEIGIKAREQHQAVIDGKSAKEIIADAQSESRANKILDDFQASLPNADDFSFPPPP